MIESYPTPLVQMNCAVDLATRAFHEAMHRANKPEPGSVTEVPAGRKLEDALAERIASDWHCLPMTEQLKLRYAVLAAIERYDAEMARFQAKEGHICP